MCFHSKTLATKYTTQHKIKQNQRTMITSSSCWMRSTRTQHRIITFCSEINKRENEVSREVHKPTLNITLLLFLTHRRHQSTAQPFINHLNEMNSTICQRWKTSQKEQNCKTGEKGEIADLSWENQFWSNHSHWQISSDDLISCRLRIKKEVGLNILSRHKWWLIFSSLVDWLHRKGSTLCLQMTFDGPCQLC